MALHSFLFVLSLAALAWSFPEVCETIADAISDSSDVYYPDLLGTIIGINHYEQDIHHWASSSSQWSLCSVQPGSAEDVGIIVSFPFLGTSFFVTKSFRVQLGILGSNRTAFAVSPALYHHYSASDISSRLREADTRLIPGFRQRQASTSRCLVSPK